MIINRRCLLCNKLISFNIDLEWRVIVHADNVGGAGMSGVFGRVVGGGLLGVEGENDEEGEQEDRVEEKHEGLTCYSIILFNCP